MGIPAKRVVVGMASNGFSIADPTDGAARPSGSLLRSRRGLTIEHDKKPD
jgi:hypothetical protein